MRRAHVLVSAASMLPAQGVGGGPEGPLRTLMRRAARLVRLARDDRFGTCRMVMLCRTPVKLAAT